MHCEIGGTQGPFGYVSALGATRLVHWLILVAPSCLRSHNARYIMLKSLSNRMPYTVFTTDNYLDLFCEFTVHVSMWHLTNNIFDIVFPINIFLNNYSKKFGFVPLIYYLRNMSKFSFEGTQHYDRWSMPIPAIASANNSGIQSLHKIYKPST